MLDQAQAIREVRRICHSQGITGDVYETVNRLGTLGEEHTIIALFGLVHPETKARYKRLVNRLIRNAVLNHEAA